MLTNVFWPIPCPTQGFYSEKSFPPIINCSQYCVIIEFDVYNHGYSVVSIGIKMPFDRALDIILSKMYQQIMRGLFVKQSENFAQI